MSNFSGWKSVVIFTIPKPVFVTWMLHADSTLKRIENSIFFFLLFQRVKTLNFDDWVFYSVAAPNYTLLQSGF